MTDAPPVEIVSKDIYPRITRISTKLMFDYLLFTFFIIKQFVLIRVIRG